jgi:hypothetical protein
VIANSKKEQPSKKAITLNLPNELCSMLIFFKYNLVVSNLFVYNCI